MTPHPKEEHEPLPSPDFFGDRGPLPAIDTLIANSELLTATEFCELYLFDWDRPLVLKIAKRIYSNRPAVRQRILSQFNMLRATASNHVASPLAFVESPNHVGYTMDYFPDGSLTEMRHDPRFPRSLEAINDYAEQVIAGVSWMHSNGWAHGDLASSNVLVAPSEEFVSGWRLAIADPLPIEHRSDAFESDVRDLHLLVQSLLYGLQPEGG